METRRVEPVALVLARVAGRWRTVADEVARVAARLRDAVGIDAYTTLVPTVDEAIEELHRAVAQFEHAANHPDVVLATTGTTSSGKSTLANLLIGDVLLPKAVQEMSAGVVTVHDDPSVRRLAVEDTHGATWPVGSWEPGSAEEVRSRLESTMQAYRDLVGEGADASRNDIEPPRFRITWPIRIARRPAAFGLPAGARLTIVDLPGLKYVGDDLNGDVVRGQARKALCLVGYNSFETDSRKQESLLRQVVDQVKALSGSPARMLFVLNRIDTFRTDRDPAASERAFAERVTRQIRSGVRDALPEYSGEAGSIEPIALSSEPGLYAVLAEEAGLGSDEPFLRKLAKEYALLFADHDLDRLPRSPAEWSEAQRRWFLSEARHQSRLNEFERRLGAHIAAHLPELLLPDLVDASFRPARKALEALDALIVAFGLRERAQADEAKARLETLHQQLRLLQKEVMAPLNPLREVAGGDGDLVERLLGAVPEVEAALGLGGQDGGPGRLSALPSALPDAVRVPLHRLNDYVFSAMKGAAHEDPFVGSAENAVRLDAAIEGLRSSAYGRVWKNGGDFEAAEGEQVKRALTDFAKELSSAATSLISRESSVQVERMKAALSACGEAVIGRIEEDSSGKLDEFGFRGLRGVFRGGFDLRPPRLPRVRFKADFRHWSRTEQQTVQEEVWVEKRVWWKLFLGKDLVKETRPVVRTTTHEGITVAKLGDLLSGFASSGDVSESEEFFAAWIGDSIAEFDQALEARLRAGVRRYRQALEQRAEEIEQGTRTRIESVSQYRSELSEALRRLEESRHWRGIAHE